jgi:uncharacterized protein YcbK (DUF882 family)
VIAEPIIITSGWRCPNRNASTEGAAKNSLHMEGKAVDFTAKSFNQLVRYAKRIAGFGPIKADEFIVYSRYIHVGYKKGAF